MDKLNAYDLNLSIIVLVYNTEIFLGECLDSIITAIKKAGLKDKTEIIVVNDGSKGNVRDIIKPYIKKNDNIIFIDKANTGRGDSRNIGLDRACGKYIHFIDSDDYIDEDIYIEIKKDILKAKLDSIVFNIEAIDTKGNRSIVYGKNENITDLKEAVLSEKIIASSCNKIIKKDMFNKVRYPANIKYEDLAVIPAVISKCNNIKYVNKEYYKYNFNDSLIIRDKFNIENLNLLDAIEVVFNNIDRINDKELNKQQIKLNLFVCRFYEDILQQIMHVDNIDEKRVYIEILCDKISNIVYIFDTYSFKELLSKYKILKRICSYYLISAIKNKRYNTIMKCLNKKVFNLLFKL